MRYDLEKAQEELIIYKTESDFTQSTKIGGDSPEPKTLHHIEVQTEGSFISPPPQHASSPQKSIQIDKGLPHRLSQATVGSPTVNIIKNLILSPAEIGNSFPTSAFKSKDSLKNNVFSREFSILGSKSSFHEPKRTTPGSPTPLKAFLNDHMEKLKRCREAACAVDLNKQYCITGGKGSQKASLTNSNNHSITNLRKSDSNTAKTLYQELIETKSRPSKSRSLKRTSPRIDGSVPKSKVTPTSCLKHDEFSKQFFGKNTKNYRSSVELPGETFTTKLGSIIQERDIFKRRTVAYPEKEVFAYGKEIFENFKMRLNKKPSFVKG
jgi:hypothetical protein